MIATGPANSAEQATGPANSPMHTLVVTHVVKRKRLTCKLASVPVSSVEALNGTGDAFLSDAAAMWLAVCSAECTHAQHAVHVERYAEGS